MSNIGIAIDIDHLRQWVGRERIVRDDLHLFRAQALAAALDRPLPAVGDSLPACWQWLYFLDTPTAAQTGADGHPRSGEFLPPAPLPRRMWAAGRFESLLPLRLGEAAQRHSVIRSVDLKEGRSGSLLFVNLEHRITQQNRLCLREEQNLVYRDMPVGAAPLPAGELAPIEADWSDLCTADPVLLFRYSALTYNGHRIHYDRSYAIEQEFYPALVVHGPLLATLLTSALQRHWPDVSIIDFKFRASRPTFDTQAFRLCGRRDGKQVYLWTADHENQVGMSATAVIA